MAFDIYVRRSEQGAWVFVQRCADALAADLCEATLWAVTHCYGVRRVPAAGYMPLI